MSIGKHVHKLGFYNYSSEEYFQEKTQIRKICNLITHFIFIIFFLTDMKITKATVVLKEKFQKGRIIYFQKVLYASDRLYQIDRSVIHSYPPYYIHARNANC